MYSEYAYNSLCVDPVSVYIIYSVCIERKVRTV